MRVFIDTNVLVSAFATRGLCADLFRVILMHHDALVSDTVVHEFRRVLTDKFRVPGDASAEVVESLADIEHLPSSAMQPEYKVRDPEDVRILADALEGKADVLLTGDTDLLDLADNVSELRIMNPRAFWEMERDGTSTSSSTSK